MRLPVQGFRVKEGLSCVFFRDKTARKSTQPSPSLTRKPTTKETETGIWMWSEAQCGRSVDSWDREIPCSSNSSSIVGGYFKIPSFTPCRAAQRRGGIKKNLRHLGKDGYIGGMRFSPVCCQNKLSLFEYPSYVQGCVV